VERSRGSTGVALHVDGRGVLDRAVAGDGAGDAGRLVVAHVGVHVWLVELVKLAIDGGVINVAVGRDQADGGEESCEELHCESEEERVILVNEIFQMLVVQK